MLFRIFTNDRGWRKGVAKYSALIDVEAEDAGKALEPLADQFRIDAPPYALPWPPDAAGEAWIAKHVQ